MLMKLRKKLLISFLLIILSLSFSNNFIFAKDSTNTISFEKQNKRKSYISISLGMGVFHSDNPSLVQFIELDVPNYSFIPNNDKVSEFSTGIQFFGGSEFQIAKTLSIKPEYSYYIKSINIPSNINYQYFYNSHLPMIILNYIFSQKNSYIKFGFGGGYLLSSFTRKERILESDYSSKGAAIKFEGIFNAQIGKSSAVYLSGFLMKSFMSDLKNSNDAYLLNLNNERVNLSSFGVGLRLGVEIYIF